MLEEGKYKKLIGQIIRNTREDLNLTQEELSARIELDQSNLSNIENGKNFPSFITFCKLIEELNVEPNNLLRFLKFNVNNKEIVDIEIEEHIKKCTPDLKEHINAILKCLRV